MRHCVPLLLGLAFAQSCSENTDFQTVDLVVSVVNEAGRPLKGVKVSVDGAASEHTNDFGNSKAILNGPEGRTAEVAITCPQGRSSPDGQVQRIPVRFINPVGGQKFGPSPLTAVFRCKSNTVRVVLLMRTDERPNLPVKALGREIGVTDANGVAQTILEGAPGEEIEVQLDTSKDPLLRPSMPMRRLSIPLESQIVIFDQSFEKRPDAQKTAKRKTAFRRPRRI